MESIKRRGFIGALCAAISGIFGISRDKTCEAAAIELPKETGNQLSSLLAKWPKPATLERWTEPPSVFDESTQKWIDQEKIHEFVPLHQTSTGKTRREWRTTVILDRFAVKHNVMVPDDAEVVGVIVQRGDQEITIHCSGTLGKAYPWGTPKIHEAGVAQRATANVAWDDRVSQSLAGVNHVSN